MSKACVQPAPHDDDDTMKETGAAPGGVRVTLMGPTVSCGLGAMFTLNRIGLCAAPAGSVSSRSKPAGGEKLSAYEPPQFGLAPLPAAATLSVTCAMFPEVPLILTVGVRVTSPRASAMLHCLRPPLVSVATPA